MILEEDKNESVCETGRTVLRHDDCHTPGLMYTTPMLKRSTNVGDRRVLYQ